MARIKFYQKVSLYWFVAGVATGFAIALLIFL